MFLFETSTIKHSNISCSEKIQQGPTTEVRRQKTEDKRKKTEDKRHNQFLRCLLLLSINHNKETNANQTVSP